MKKVHAVLLSVICLITCVFTFSACGRKAVELTVGETSDTTAADYSMETDYVYGDDRQILSDIKKLRFCGTGEDNSKFGIPIINLSEEYSKDGEIYYKKPDKFTVGEWTAKYWYKDPSVFCEVYFNVEKSSHGKFTARLERSQWTYGDALPKIEIKNPDGKTVEPSTDGDLLDDDTNIRQGTLCAMGFKKSYYDTLGDKKTDVDFLWEVYCTYGGGHRDEVVINFSNASSFGAGKWVLVILDTVGTYNYENIVCAVEFTVI